MDLPICVALLKSFTVRPQSAEERTVFDLVSSSDSFMDYILTTLASSVEDASRRECYDVVLIQELVQLLGSVLLGWANEPESCEGSQAQLRLLLTVQAYTKTIKLVSTFKVINQLKTWEFIEGAEGICMAGRLMLFICHVKPLLEQLITSDIGLFAKNGGQLLAELYSYIRQHPEPFRDDNPLYQWASELLKSIKSNDQSTVKSVMSFCLVFERRMGDYVVAKGLSADLLHTLGGMQADDEPGEGGEPEVYSFLAYIGCCNAVAKELFKFADSLHDDVDWSLQEYKSLSSAKSREELKRKRGLLEQIEIRLSSVVTILSKTMSAPLPTLFDVELRLLVKVYKTHAALAKAKWTDKEIVDGVSDTYDGLIMNLGTNLTPNVYKLITYAQNAERERAAEDQGSRKRKLASSKKAATVSKHLRTIPTLIYEIEQFEQWLIKIVKKSKVNLMKYCKRSTARDFRIQLDDVGQENRVSQIAGDRIKCEDDDESSVADELSVSNNSICLSQI